MADQLRLRFLPINWGLKPAEIAAMDRARFRRDSWWRFYSVAHARGVALDTGEPCTCSVCVPRIVRTAERKLAANA